MLGLLNLNAMKERVKGLARDISALGLQREAEGSLQFPLGKVAEKEGIGREREELHQQLLLKVADSVIERDFVRLKGLCKSWIEPAVLQNITSTQELLEQLQQQAIINVGEYSKLTHMLHQLHLKELKDQVEKLSSEIKTLDPLDSGYMERQISESYVGEDEFEYDYGTRRKLGTTAATIDGAAGGVIRCKEVQLTVPPNAISGLIKIEFVDQQLVARAVHDNTKGKANIHCQGICVTCTDEDVIFSEPVEVRVTVRTMLERAGNQQLGSEGFRILREKNGDVTDITEDCNVRLLEDELVFYSKTFSIFNIAQVADFASGIVTSLFTTIKYIFKTSYMCKICPYIKGRHDEGFIIKLYCHGEHVECSGGLEHECVGATEKHRLPNEVTLWFEVECRCIETSNVTTLASTKDLKLKRSVCQSTGQVFAKVMPDAKALVAGKVQLFVHALNCPSPLLDMSVKVHDEEKDEEVALENDHKSNANYLTLPPSDVMINVPQTVSGENPYGATDSLGYHDYADALADFLLDYELTTGTTIGLLGNWGAGKSFLLTTLKKRIMEKNADDKTQKIKWIVEEWWTCPWLAYFVTVFCILAFITGWTWLAVLLEAFEDLDLYLYVNTRDVCIVIIIIIIVIIVICYQVYLLCHSRMGFLFTVAVVVIVFTVVLYLSLSGHLAVLSNMTSALPDCLAAFTNVNKLLLHVMSINYLWIFASIVVLIHLVSSLVKHWEDFLKIVLLVFCQTPPSPTEKAKVKIIEVQFSAWEYAGSDFLWAGIVCNMSAKVEKYFGFWKTRLFQVFHALTDMSVVDDEEPKESADSQHVNIRLRQISFLPCYVVAWFCFCVTSVFCIRGFVTLAKKYFPDEAFPAVIFSVILLVVSNYSAIKSYLVSPAQRIMNMYKSLSNSSFEEELGFMNRVKGEINNLAKFIKYMNCVDQRHYRLLIVIDDIDRLEKKKIRKILQAVNVLLSDSSHPFISILAIDPRIAESAVEQSFMSNRSSKSSDLSGHEYLKKIVHLPFFIPVPNRHDVRVFYQALTKGSDSSDSAYNRSKIESKRGELAGVNNGGEEGRRGAGEAGRRKVEQKKQNGEGRMGRDKKQDKYGETTDIRDRVSKDNKQAVEVAIEEYDNCAQFIYRNPRNMKRIFNVMMLTLKLFWKNEIKRKEDISDLAMWTILSEQWPCAANWLVAIYEDEKNNISSDTCVVDLFEGKEDELHEIKKIPFFESMDRNSETFFSFLRTHPRNASDLMKFTSVSVNTDHSIRDKIARMRRKREHSSVNT